MRHRDLMTGNKERKGREDTGESFVLELLMNKGHIVREDRQLGGQGRLKTFGGRKRRLKNR